MKQNIPILKANRKISKLHDAQPHSTTQHLLAKDIFKKMHPLAELTAPETKYDFIAYGFRVKIKASTLSKKTNDWCFNIRKNTGFDHFVFMAFDDVKNGKLIHLWIFDATIISDLSIISISEETLSEWSDCEVDLDGWT